MLFSHGISTHKHRPTNETKKQMKQFHPQTLYIMQENEKKKKIQIYFFMFLFFVGPAYSCDCVCARLWFMHFSYLRNYCNPFFSEKRTNTITKYALITFQRHKNSCFVCLWESEFSGIFLFFFLSWSIHLLVFENCLRKCMRKEDVCVYFVSMQLLSVCIYLLLGYCHPAIQ